jgi:hypothetical protein
VAVAVTVRLPHLLGGHVALDGDESIVGLMARDLLAGKRVPVFFYGQRYGLALVEVAPLAAAFRLFGEAPIVIKATILALWLVGGIFAVRAAGRFAGTIAALGTALVLATLPAWIGWSMKARGGYVTAFVASQIALWIIAGMAEPWRRGAGLALGVCLALVFFAQPFFVLPILPFLLLVERRAWTRVALGLAAVAIPLALASQGSLVAWQPRLFGPFDPQSVAAMGERIPTALGGVFFYTEAGAPPQAARFAGGVLDIMFAVGVGYAVFARARDRSTDAIRRAAAGAMLVLCAVLWIRADEFAYRYLLPIAAPLAFLIGAIAARISAAGWVRSATLAIALLSAIGASVAWADRAVSFAVVPGDDVADETAATGALLEHLRARGIAHVFVTDPMYQWNLIFESGGHLAARWIYALDRIPEIPRAVDRALREGRPVALIGDARYADRTREALRRSGLALRLDVVAGRHFVLESPPAALLRSLGFELDETNAAQP